MIDIEFLIVEICLVFFPLMKIRFDEKCHIYLFLPKIKKGEKLEETQSIRI
jgi:hypothetical protein